MPLFPVFLPHVLPYQTHPLIQPAESVSLPKKSQLHDKYYCCIHHNNMVCTLPSDDESAHTGSESCP